MQHLAAWFLGGGALSALIAVLLGAFGAHGLRARLDQDMLAVYQTGVQYQFYHALGLLLVGVLLRQGVGGWLPLAGWLLLAGSVLFSGSLYLLALGSPRWLGAITPLGGLAFVLAWLAVAVSVWRD